MFEAKNTTRATGLARRRRLGGAVLGGVLMALAGQAGAAEAVLGTWASPPDRKGQTGHVVIRDCGGAYCGRLERAFDPQGQEITTRAVGEMVLRGMAPETAGTYHGEVYVPLLDKVVEARVEVQGDRLEVRGCAGIICNSQTWQRVP